MNTQVSEKRTWVSVDFGALTQNIKALKQNLPNGSKLAAVVKANAYGHGAVAISRVAVAGGADLLCFATAAETREVIKADIEAPMLVMGAPLSDSLDIIVDFRVRQCVFLPQHVLDLQKKAEEKQSEALVHVKIDTGMNRIGVKTKAEFEALLDTMVQCDRVTFEGMFTHFAVSDEADKDFSRKQAATFDEYYQMALDKGFSPIRHASNSGAIIDMPEYAFDFVRAGIAMYGYYPSSEVFKQRVDLKPVMGVFSHLVHIKTVLPGESVSYGRTFVAKKPMRVGTVPIGYGDGYNRLLSNQGEMLVGGKRAKILGRVCMDMTMIDLTDIEEAEIGDEVTVMGQDGEERITADDLAKLCGTISYEVVLSFTTRLPRIYIDG